MSTSGNGCGAVVTGTPVARRFGPNDPHGRFVSFEDVNWGGLAAAATIITVPILALSLIVQRYLAGGLTMGAVKG